MIEPFNDRINSEMVFIYLRYPTPVSQDALVPSGMCTCFLDMRYGASQDISYTLANPRTVGCQT